MLDGEWIPLREELMGSEDDKVICEDCKWNGVLSDLLVNKSDENDTRHLCPVCKEIVIKGDGHVLH